MSPFFYYQLKKFTTTLTENSELKKNFFKLSNSEETQRGKGMRMRRVEGNHNYYEICHARCGVSLDYIIA
jgi:hypothetical protein